jgi:hypothetical protein
VPGVWHKVAVFVARTKRPFINCGFCSARIFYNGSRSMQLLQKQITDSKVTVIESGGQEASRVVQATPAPGLLSGLYPLHKGKR